MDCVNIQSKNTAGKCLQDTCLANIIVFQKKKEMPNEKSWMVIYFVSCCVFVEQH